VLIDVFPLGSAVQTFRLALKSDWSALEKVPRYYIIDACFCRAEIAPAHIQSTKYIAIFTSNSHDGLRRIDLVHFEKPPGFPSVR
jgi:hypothetical protein